MDLQKIQGRHSREISAILGYEGAETVIHRDNLVLT
jgi:glutamate 5-kinase